MFGDGEADVFGMGVAAEVGRARAAGDHGLDRLHDRVVRGAARALPLGRKSSISAPDQIIAIGLAMR